MKYATKVLLLSSAVLAATLSVGHAQVTASDTTAAAPMSRSEVKMDRDEFFKAHRLSSNDGWVLKPGFMPPMGVEDPPLTRDQVKMDRDEFLRTHREESPDVWVLKRGFAPPEGVPVHVLTRQEVRMDRAEFLRTHEWRSNTVGWVLKTGYVEPSAKP